MEIVNSNKKDKRFKAIFSNGKKVDFGLNGGSTYIDHKDEKKKENYIKRHRVRENWEDYMSAGALSRYILWEYQTLDKAVSSYKKRFNLPYAKINI